MKVETVTTADQSLLDGVRRTLSSADEALLCVAFVHSRGVHLIEKELGALSARQGSRLVVTTTFDMSGGAALATAASLGVKVSTLNPGSGSTYHPKVYLGRRGSALQALIGSANLTGGLATNVEAAVLLEGTTADAPLVELWSWAERVWGDPRTEPWLASAAEAGDGDDELLPVLLDGITAAAQRDPVFLTLGPKPARNLVTEVTRSEVLVETDRSAEKRGGAAPIPAWMFNLAWEYLTTRGRLSNAELLNHLRVHRSSAVCAVLARLPGVRVTRGAGIVLRYKGVTS